MDMLAADRGRRVIKEGVLCKRSEFVKSWNERFVVLTSESLCWHRVTDGGGRGDLIRGVALASVASAGGYNAVRRAHAFMLSMHGGAPDVYLCAASDAEAYEWVSVLNAAVREVRPRPTCSRC